MHQRALLFAELSPEMWATVRRCQPPSECINTNNISNILPLRSFGVKEIVRKRKIVKLNNTTAQTKISDKHCKMLPCCRVGLAECTLL